MFKKIISILTSRILFFVLGISVVLGAGYALAFDWAPAKPSEGTTPDQLSQANWEAVVNGLAEMDRRLSEVKTKVDSLSSGGGASGPAAISPRSTDMWRGMFAAEYCFNLNSSAAYAFDEDTTTVYSDWRLPSVEELAVFVRYPGVTITDAWTGTPGTASTVDSKMYYIFRTTMGTYKLDNYDTGGAYFVVCVR